MRGAKRRAEKSCALDIDILFVDILFAVSNVMDALLPLCLASLVTAALEEEKKKPTMVSVGVEARVRESTEERDLSGELEERVKELTEELERVNGEFERVTEDLSKVTSELDDLRTTPKGVDR